MSSRRLGRVIKSVGVTTTSSNASGIFSTGDVTELKSINKFPGIEPIELKALKSQGTVVDWYYPQRDIMGYWLQPDHIQLGANGQYMYLQGDGTFDSIVQFELKTYNNTDALTYLNRMSTGENGDINVDAFCFSANGSILYTHDQPSYYKYNLSTPWDISTATYDSNWTSPTDNRAIENMWFSSNGTYFYTTESNSTDNVMQCTLGTPFDLSTNTELMTNGSLSLDYDDFHNAFMSADGSQLIITQEHGSLDNYVVVYNLATPWELSTATWAGRKYVQGDRESTDLRSGTFGAGSGNTVVFFSTSYDDVMTYPLLTNNDFLTAQTAVSTRASLEAFHNSQYAIEFIENGSKMWQMRYGTDDQHPVFQEYAFTTAYDQTTQYMTGKFWSPGEWGGYVRGFTFGDSGNYLFTINSYPTDRVYRFSLSTAYDISTANVNPSSVQVLSVNTQETDNYSISLKSDGTKLYHIGQTGDDINEWALSSAWDLTTATHTGQTTLGTGVTTARQHRWNSDGTKLYLINNGDDTLREYSLSTAWDSSTIGTSTSYSITSMDNQPTSFDFNADGTDLFVTGLQYDERIRRADLAGAYDFSTITIDPNYASIELTARGLYMANNGSYAYICGYDNDRVYRVTTDGSYAFTEYSDNQSRIDQMFDASTENASPSSVWFKPDGTIMYIQDYNAEINQYTLSSAWDLTTASYASKSYNISAVAGIGTIQSIAISPDGATLLAYDIADSGGVKEFTLSTPWDITTASQTANEISFAEAMTGGHMGMSYDGKHVYLSSTTYSFLADLTLTSAWDITTWTGQVKILCPFRPAITPFIGGAATNPAGNKLFVVGSTTSLNYIYDSDRIQEFYLNTPHDIGSINRKYSSITLQDLGDIGIQQGCMLTGSNHYYSLHVEYDDTVLWTHRLNDDWTSAKTYSYYSSTGTSVHDWRLRNAARVKDAKTLTMFVDDPRGMWLSKDESRLFIIDNYGFIQSFRMTEAGDIKTLEYVEGMICQQVITDTTVDSSWQDLTFSSDGTELYVVNSSTDFVYRITLSTAFDLSSGSYTEKLDLTSTGWSYGNVQNIDLNHNGTRLYFTDYTYHSLRYFTLGTAYSIDATTSPVTFNGKEIFQPYSYGTDWYFKFGPGYDTATISSSLQIFRISGFDQGKIENVASNTDVTTTLASGTSDNDLQWYLNGRIYKRGDPNTYVEMRTTSGISGASYTTGARLYKNGVQLGAQEQGLYGQQSNGGNSQLNGGTAKYVWMDPILQSDFYQRASGYTTWGFYWGRMYFSTGTNIQGWGHWGAYQGGTNQRYDYGGFSQLQGGGPNSQIESANNEYQIGSYTPDFSGVRGTTMKGFCFNEDGTYLYFADEDAFIYQVPVSSPWNQTTAETDLTASTVKVFNKLTSWPQNTYDATFGFDAGTIAGMDFNDTGDVLAMIVGNSTTNTQTSMVRFLILGTPWDISTATPADFCVFPYKEHYDHYWEFSNVISFRNNKLTVGFQRTRGSSAQSTASGDILGMEMSLSANDVKTYSSLYTYLTANTSPPATLELNTENLLSANVSVSAVDDQTITYYASVTSGNGNIFANTALRNGLEITSSNGTFLLLANTTANSTNQDVSANVTFTANSADPDAPITLGTTLVNFNFAGSYGKQYADAYVAGTGGSIVTYSGGSGTDITSTLVGLTNGDCLLLPEGSYDLEVTQGGATYSSEPFNNKECAIIGDTNDPANVVISFQHTTARDKPIFSTADGAQTPTDKRQMAFLTLSRIDGSTTNYIAALIRGNGGNAKGRLVNVYFENATSTHDIAWGYDNSNSSGHDVQFIRCTFANYAAWDANYNFGQKGGCYAKDCLYEGTYNTSGINFYGTNQASATLDTANRTYNTSTYSTAGHLYVPSDFTNDANTS